MTPPGSEPAIPAGDRPQPYTLVRVATGIDQHIYYDRHYYYHHYLPLTLLHSVLGGSKKSSCLKDQHSVLLCQKRSQYTLCVSASEYIEQDRY